MENRGPIIAILILDKPAKSDMVVQVIDNGVTATGKLRINAIMINGIPIINDSFAHSYTMLFTQEFVLYMEPCM